MWAFDQCLVAQSLVRISMREVIITSILYGFHPKTFFFFEGSSWFKFNNLELAACMTLKFYTSVTKGLKLRVRKFLGKTPKFEKLTEENLARGLD